jgi:hypothetical protein
MHPTLLYIVQLIFAIISGSFVSYLILKQKGLWFDNNKKNEKPNHVNDEIITTIKVKKVKPQDDSVPFTTTGFTHNNVVIDKQQKRKNPLSQGYKQQNPRYDSNTFQPKPTSTSTIQRSAQQTASALKLSNEDIEKMKKIMGLISK